MTDFKIEVIIKDVARGDLDQITAFLDEVAPEYDTARGDFNYWIAERENENRSWFSEVGV